MLFSELFSLFLGDDKSGLLKTFPAQTAVISRWLFMNSHQLTALLKKVELRVCIGSRWDSAIVPSIDGCLHFSHCRLMLSMFFVPFSNLKFYFAIWMKR
jgi:hypothetical protein